MKHASLSNCISYFLFAVVFHRPILLLRAATTLFSHSNGIHLPVSESHGHSIWVVYYAKCWRHRSCFKTQSLLLKSYLLIGEIQRMIKAYKCITEVCKACLVHPKGMVTSA